MEFQSGIARRGEVGRLGVAHHTQRVAARGKGLWQEWQILVGPGPVMTCSMDAALCAAWKNR